MFRFLAYAAPRLEPLPSQERILSAFGSGQPRTASETLLSHTYEKSSAEGIKAFFITHQSSHEWLEVMQAVERHQLYCNLSGGLHGL